MLPTPYKALGHSFDELQFLSVPSIRYLLTYFATVGVVAFYSILLTNGNVELVDLEIDPQYWETISMDPALMSRATAPQPGSWRTS